MSDSTTTPPTPATEAPKPTPPASAPNEGTPTGPVQLPDDHPLVKALAAQKAEITALKAAADTGKTEAEKASERLASIEDRAAKAEARVTRREVALEFGLSKDDAALLDAITDEDAMRGLAKRLQTAQADAAKNGNHVPREGATPSTQPDERRAFANFLTGNRV